VIAATGIATFGSPSEINEITKITDGHLLCGAILADDNQTLNTIVIRLNDEDGDIVNTFTNGGILNVAQLTYDMALGIALQGSEHAAVVGSFGDDVRGIVG